MNPTARSILVRVVILALTVCVAVLLYLDRFCLSFVVTYIREDLRLTSGQTGFLLGAFFLTYAFGQIPGGWLADRYGTRMMLAFYLAVWSVLTGLMGLATTFVALLLFRFGCGLFEAGAYPACAGLIRRWIPKYLQGLASGVVSIGGRIGGAVSPVMTAYLMAAFMPVSTSSLITASDILKPRKLARDVLLMSEADMPAHVRQAAKRLQSRLQSETSIAVHAVADLPSDADTTVPSTAESATPAQKIMAEAVNVWLKQPDLLEGINVESIRLKLNQQSIELLDKEPAERSAADSARLNRLVLEVMFPDSIRKLYGDSWQPVLMIYGAIGVLVALIFYSFYRDTPA